jgi:hypothetical protein
MAPTNRGVIAASIVAGAIVVAAIVAPIVVAIRLGRLGYRPFAMILSPHDAYVLARGRREVSWHGLRIHVGAKFVIENVNGAERVSRIVPSALIFLQPAMSFHALTGGTVRTTDSVRTRCVADTANCTVHEIVVHAGTFVCFQRRSARHPEQFELWQCRLPNGMWLTHFGTPVECAEQQQIALAAFASAEPAKISP